MPSRHACVCSYACYLLFQLHTPIDLPVLHVCSYVCYLFFQLHTHVDLFDAPPSANPEELEEVETPLLSLPCAIMLLAGISVTVAVLSEYVGWGGGWC